MSRILRAVVLTTALLGAFASSASAITWDNSGDTAFTASGGATTLHFGGVHMPCSGITATGTTGSTPFSGATWTNAASGTLTFGHCTIAGQTYSIDCTYNASLTGQTGGTSTGSLATTCGLYVFTTKICGISGTIPTHYTNPSGGTPGSFTLTQTALTLSNGPVGTCPYGTSGTLTHQTLTVTSGTGGPVITRTP